MNLKYSASNRGTPRVAVVVSKKVSKVAPVRNRLRRRIYEVIRIHLDSIDPGYDFVVTVFDKRVDELSPAALQDDIKTLLKKAKLS